MKRNLIFFAASALMLFAACAQKESLEVENVNRVNAVLYAAMEQEEASPSLVSSKVNVSGNTLSWADGDKIAVYTTAGKFEEMALESVTDGVGRFTGELEGELLEGNPAVYPVSAAVSASEGNITVKYPETYSYTASNINIPMLATVSLNGNTEFKHLGGAIKFVCSNVPDWAVKFVFESEDKTITGTYELSQSPGTAVAESAEGSTGRSVKISFSKSNSDMIFYVPLPKGVYSNFSVWFEDEEGKEISGTRQTAVNASQNAIERTSLCGMPEIEYTPWFTINWVFGGADKIKQFGANIPAIDVNGNVYITNRGEAHMYKVGADGTLKNTFNFPAWTENTSVFVSPSVEKDGSVVYACGSAGGSGAFYAINTSDFSQKWSTKQFVNSGFSIWKGRTAITDGAVYVAAGSSGGLCSFNKETGDRISYGATSLSSDGATATATNPTEGPVITIDGAVFCHNSQNDYGFSQADMENPTNKTTANVYYSPAGANVQHTSWSVTEKSSMCALKYDDVNYYVAMACESKGYDMHAHFIPSTSAMSGDFPGQNLNECTKCLELVDAKQDYGGVVAGARNEAVFALKSNGNSSDKPNTFGGIVAAYPDGTEAYRYPITKNLSGSCAIDNNGYVHMIDDNANYIIVKPDYDTKKCALVAKANMYDLIKAAGKLPDTSAVACHSWTSIKIGNDGRIYLNLNFANSSYQVLYGATVCMNYKETTSPSQTSSWPQDGADPMNTNCQLR